MDQNLSLYRIFCVTAETGNISKASSKLFISQPAISKSIAKLEQNLGIDLFIRSSRGVTLTEEGEQLYRSLKSAFEIINSSEENIKRIKELGIGHLKIGVSSTLCKHMLMPYLQTFLKSHPHIQVTISCTSTLQTLKMLESNEIDIGLIGKPDYLKNLCYYSFEEIEDTFVATKDYVDNLIIRDGINPSDILTHANVMLLEKGNITRQYINRYFSQNDIEPSTLLEINNMDLLIDFAKIGLGVACVIKQFVQKELDNGSLIEIPLKSPIHKREVCFAYSNNSIHTRAVTSFMDSIRERHNAITT